MVRSAWVGHCRGVRILPRLLGAATALYSVAIIIRPALLARPCGLSSGPDGTTVATPVVILIRAIGARDVAIGTAMVCAPRGSALRTATAARVAADAADALVFGTQLGERDRRMKIGGFAAGWALLCGLSARWAG
jgi:hypothetical protein